MGIEEHPIPHPGPPRHSLDPCGMVRGTGLVYLCRADHQVTPRQHCPQHLCTLLSSVPFFILLYAAFISPATASSQVNTCSFFFSHGFQFCYICTQIKYFWYGYLGARGLAGLHPWRSPAFTAQLSVKPCCFSHNSLLATCEIQPSLMVLSRTSVSSLRSYLSHPAIVMSCPFPLHIPLIWLIGRAGPSQKSSYFSAVLKTRWGDPAFESLLSSRVKCPFVHKRY